MPRASRPQRILLTSVVGPYGVDDDYGRKENIMELLHNQVTKGQGIASWRFHHRSFGLYLMAANLRADVTILDFPSWSRFRAELERPYDIIGISFITPNFLKTREMAREVRRLAPDAELVLGGHGAAIEGVEELIEHDHIVRGDGIRWLRNHIGQDVDDPVVHPTMPSIERMSAYGVPFPGTGANLIVTGVGCVNGCKFCSTSHYFGREYTNFMASGKELFRTACRMADENGVEEFYIMDENFLKEPRRARELLQEMEKHRRHFTFQIFSSSETIRDFGIDNLVRLGVDLIWIGFEASGKQGNFEKNDGVDARQLVQQLRDRGIRVLASGILCQEHHTPDTIRKDIDFMVGLEADLVQFMLLTPLPTTALYRDHQQRGMLRTDLPYEEWHGQKYLSFNHPHFPDGEPEKWINRAFRKDYEVNSSSMYRVIDTAFRGYRRLAAMNDRDPWLDARLEQFRARVLTHRTMLPVIARNAVNPCERDRARTLDRAITEALGSPTLRERCHRTAATLCALRWRLRLKWFGDVMQPKTLYTRYDHGSLDRLVACGATTTPVTSSGPATPARQLHAANETA